MRPLRKRRGSLTKLASLETNPMQSIDEDLPTPTPSGMFTIGDHSEMNGTSNGTANRTSLNGIHKEPVYPSIEHQMPEWQTIRKGLKRSASKVELLSEDLAKSSGQHLKYATIVVITLGFLVFFPHYFTIMLRPNLPPVVGGFVAPGFEKVAQTFQ